MRVDLRLAVLDRIMLLGGYNKCRNRNDDKCRNRNDERNAVYAGEVE